MDNLSSYSDQGTENRLTSEKFMDFREALDVLFIRDNISGRIKFAAAWPEAALYVLSEELVTFDREGVRDRTRRAELEREAEIRRAELLEILEALEEKSVVSGILQMEFVGDLVRRLGRGFALYVYGRKIVDRFAPPPPEQEQLPEEKRQDESAQVSENPVFVAREMPTPSRDEMSFSVAAPDISLDDVKPIAVGMPETPLPSSASKTVSGVISGRFIPARKKTEGTSQG